MSRQTVRAQIAAYLTAGIGTVEYLTNVYAYPPKTTAAGELIPQTIPGQDSGAVAYLHLTTQSEQRIALGGPTSGRKQVAYNLGIIIFQYGVNVETQVLGEENDKLLDSLVAYIRASRTAGTGGAVFQWGEGTLAGGEDIHILASMPVALRQQGAYVFATLETTVLEIDTT